MPPSLIAAACAVLEEHDRLATNGSYEARAELLSRMRDVLDSWSAGRMTAQQAERALHGLLLDS